MTSNANFNAGVVLGTWVWGVNSLYTHSLQGPTLNHARGVGFALK